MLPLTVGAEGCFVVVLPLSLSPPALLWGLPLVSPLSGEGRAVPRLKRTCLLPLPLLLPPSLTRIEVGVDGAPPPLLPLPLPLPVLVLVEGDDVEEDDDREDFFLEVPPT